MDKFKNINKRLKILLIIIVILFFIITLRLGMLIFFNDSNYLEYIKNYNNTSYVNRYAKRGTIYDRNGKILAYDEEVKVLNYTKGILTTKEELDIAYELSSLFDIDFESVSKDDLKKYYFNKYKEKILKKANNGISEKYKSRLISSDEYNSYLYKIIEYEDINSLTQDEKKASYIYSLMNKGYYNEIKVIKKDIDSYISNLSNYLDKGFSIGIMYKRSYPYESVFKEFLGNIGSISKEEEKYYISKGYKLNDIVGTTYIEKKYEEYLKGTNEEFIINAKGKKEIVKRLKNGNDITLSIDIDLISEVNEIIYEEIINAKNELNTEYYNKSFVIISNPNTGEIYSSNAVGIINDKNYTKVEYLSDLINYAVTPGSIVKAASHLAGYKYGALKMGYTVTDGCIKVKNTKEKCSFKKLGIINDLTALKYSSNYYQFLIAINMGEGTYKYNSFLNLNKEGFLKYREVFNSFGLGVLTNIDLPNENVGVTGNDENEGSLLDYPIGQYETYTPMEIIQYINTLATSGKRYSLHYLLNVKNNEEIIYEYKNNILNNVDINIEYMERVKEGLKMVMESGGTGANYINKEYLPAGKTGTSESFIDTDNDGKIDTETISSSFGAYAPYNDPKVSIVVLSPNVSDKKTSFTSRVNKRITRKVSDLYFQKYNY